MKEEKQCYILQNRVSDVVGDRVEIIERKEER